MALRRKDGSWQVARLPNGDWHPEEIKAAVRMSERGMNLVKLALANGLHIRAAGRALRMPHYEGELVIAKQLGLTPFDIWPSRHEADGTRACQVRTQYHANPKLSPGHCESRAAA